MTTDISTDLITPLGAYLRLREAGGGAFLLESVDQGRLGRHSFVGCGSRLVYLNEAEACGEPVVGYLGYDYVAQLEPTVPLPADGHDLPESRFVVADIARPLRPRRRASPRCSAATPPRSPRCSPPPRLSPRARPGPDPRDTRFPDAGGVRAPRPRREGPHPRGRRVPDRPLPARRAADRRRRALALYRALRRVNPSPYLFLLELGGLALVGSSPETLVKLRGAAGEPEPDRGHDRARRGDAERLLASEKERAEHVMLVDLGRNDLARVCAPGTVRVERFLEPERYSHVMHLVSEVAGGCATA